MVDIGNEKRLGELEVLYEMHSSGVEMEPKVEKLFRIINNPSFQRRRTGMDISLEISALGRYEEAEGGSCRSGGGGT
jgi:hypothetical protein